MKRPYCSIVTLTSGILFFFFYISVPGIYTEAIFFFHSTESQIEKCVSDARYLGL